MRSLFGNGSYRTYTRHTCIGIFALIAAIAIVTHARAEEPISYWPAGATEDTAWTGRLQRVDAHLAILTVRGSPAERGEAHGKLLGKEVAVLVASVRKCLTDEKDKAHYPQCVDGARTMAKFVDADVVAELNACAKAADVDGDELMLAQLFGDVNRAKGFTTLCSSFAAFGEATAEGKLLVGRNFDYAGHGLEGGVPLILQEIPTGLGAGRSFVTLGYAGILNGWTAMNTAGLCASNNTLYGGKNTLDGMSTCFMLRKIVERAGTVEEGAMLVRNNKRACTTGMLIAGKNEAGKWDARFVEYDAEKVAVVEPAKGIVQATNQRQKLSFDTTSPGAPTCERYAALKLYLNAHDGKLSFEDAKQNPVGAKGVYMSINLHCALLDPPGQRFRAAFADGDGKPAAEKVFRDFEVKAAAVVVHPSK
jgi:hypothetical protein